MIAVIDYKMGNLGSVAKALHYLGRPAEVVTEPDLLNKAEAVILPGVGAMSYARQQLRSSGLDQAITRYVASGRPFLGICLGMQLMFERSQEGDAEGLGLLAGEVQKFAAMPGLKIPHMGWNRLERSSEELLSTDYYYFVHSYHCCPDDSSLVAAVSVHGIEFAAAVRRDNMLLTQFHPEKSGDAGLRLLDSWLIEGGL